jgi:hypothetical protein
MRAAPFLGILLPILACAGILTPMQPALGSVDTAAVITAIQRDICFSTYWGGKIPKQEIRPVALRIDGDIAYVWIENLRWHFDVPRGVSFFQVMNHKGRTAVSYSQAHNLDYFKGDEFDRLKNVVFGGPFEQTQLKTPTDCTRKFEADTPLKKQMLDVIEHSVARELTSYNKLLGEHYPDRLKIVIANFNDYDPETYILVPSTGAVFSAGIGPLYDDDLDRGGLVLQPLYRKAEIASMRGYITKIGIEREIELGK